jgi:hypothetical protein
VDALLRLRDAPVSLVGRRLDVQPHQVAMHSPDDRRALTRRGCSPLQLVLARVARPVRRALLVSAELAAAVG